MEYTYHANTNQKKTKKTKKQKTGLAVLKSVHVDSGKIDFKTKTLVKKTHISLMKKGPNPQEEIIILNLHVASKHMCQNLTKPKGELKKFAMTLEVLSHLSQQAIGLPGKNSMQIKKSKQNTKLKLFDTS